MGIPVNRNIHKYFFAALAVLLFSGLSLAADVVIDSGNAYIDGNVGVGLTNPAQKLSVAGVIESTNGGFKFPDGTVQLTAGGGGGGSLWTLTGSDIYYNTGKVGIGTTAPSNPLHIVYSGADLNNGALFVDAAGSSLNTYSAITVRVPATNLQKGLLFASGSDTAGWASFARSAGGAGKPGFDLGAGGSTARDTNIYRDAANVLKTDDSLVVGTALSVLGSGNSYLTGNVGVGTASPNAKLHILQNQGSLNLEGTDHTYIQWYPDGYAAGRKAYTGFPGAAIDDFYIANEITGADIILNPTATGNVGVGTTAPSTILTLGGTAPVISTDTSDAADNKYVAITGGGVLGNTRGAMVVAYGNEYTASAYGMLLLRAGNAYSGTTDGSILFQTGAAASRMIIDYSGNVGIGTASPNNKLTVSGNADVTGTLRVGANSGGAGVAGDIVARRSANTGAYYFGDNINNYLYFDGTNYIFGGTGGLSVGGNTVWNAGNDGSGSGLDADTTDTYHLNQDVRSTATPTFTGLSAGSQRITNVATPTAASDAATMGYVLSMGSKTMYMTSAIYTGSHNCDDTSCCASGYHFCDGYEWYGRRVETSGAGRNTQPGGASVGAWIDGKSNLGPFSYAADCLDWTDATNANYGHLLTDRQGGPMFLTQTCNSGAGIWCCMD